VNSVTTIILPGLKWWQKISDVEFGYNIMNEVMQTYKYSVVIPVFNSSKLIGKVVEHTKKLFINNKLDYEILLINDGSKDESWDVIERIAKNDLKVTSINLLKNYGQHTAIYCGFEHSKGDYVITIDDDMQNPPEEIIKLIRKIDEGYDVVFGSFIQKQHTTFRNMGSFFIRWINKFIFHCPQNIIPTNFRIIRRDVVNRILQYQTAYPYITGLVLMFSNNIANVKVEHKKREIGKSNYNFQRIIKLVFRILFNYSIWPMRVVGTIGFIVAFLCFIFGVIITINELRNNIQVEGWAGIIVMLALLNGVVIMILGMLGEYISRIIQQISSKNIYYTKGII